MFCPWQCWLLSCIAGVLAVFRRASDCREGALCVGLSQHSKGYRQPVTTSSHERAFRDVPPASFQGGGGGRGGGLLPHCLHSDYKADHICNLLFLLCTQPSVLNLRLFFLLFQGSGMWAQRWNNKTSSWNVVHWELRGLLLELISLC